MAEPRCIDHLHHLSDFLDEDLEPTLRATLEAHIDRCANCRIVVDTLRQTVLLYNFYPTEEPAQECLARLLEKLQLDIAEFPSD